MAINHGKYLYGRALKPIDSPNVVNGIHIPSIIIAKVINRTGHDAVLCMKGIFLVRIICTINVCESSPSTNHPDWNRAAMLSLLHLKTHHIIA